MNLCSALLFYLSLKRLDMARMCNNGITQFYLPLTHEPYQEEMQGSAIVITLMR